MAEYCLPREKAAAFLAAIKNGTIAPEKMAGMSSAERRSLFNDIVGEDHAENVNALYESKMLLKDQQRGLVTWAKKLTGVPEARRNDILAQIGKLDRVLNPSEERAFLADLAKRKLGVTVTSDEAKAIFDLGKDAQAKKAAMENTAAGSDERMAYGAAINKMGDYVDSLKPNYRNNWERAKDIANIPASALTFGHFSAPMVHGWGMIGTRQWWTGLADMFKYAASEAAYQQSRNYIVSHPDYALAVKGRLGFTDLGMKLTRREEAIQSSLLEQMNKAVSDKTGLPNLVRGSSRAYVGYLNALRFNRFTELVKAARLAGEDVSLGSSTARDLAKVVNDFTGRGDLDLGSIVMGTAKETERYGSLQPVLNATFFSPRKMSATMSMFSPARYVNPAISPTARIAAAKQLTGALMVTGAILGLAAGTGATVVLNPLSTDFMKPKFGDHAFDLTGGNAAWIRLLSRFAMGQTINSKGKLTELGQGFAAPTRGSIVFNYLRYKLTPGIAETLADFMWADSRSPFSVPHEIYKQIGPIFVQNYLEFLRTGGLNENPAAIVLAMSGIIGTGVESPFPEQHSSSRDVWGEKWADHSENSPVDHALAKAGVVASPADKNIRGVKLNDAQYDEFQQYTGRMSKQALARVVSQPWFNQLSPGRQADMLEKTTRQQREIARTTMLAHHPDLIQAANQAKLQRLREGTPAQIKRREAAK